MEEVTDGRRRGKGKLKFELVTSYNRLSAAVVCKECQGNTFAPGSCSASVNVNILRVHYCQVFLQSMAATSCYIRSYPLIDSITLTIPYLSKYSLESEAIFKYIHQCENENEKCVHQMKFSVRTLVVPFRFLLTVKVTRANRIYGGKTDSHERRKT